MNSYKNFLPNLFFNKLNDIVTSNNFQWYFQEKTVRNKLLEGENQGIKTAVFNFTTCDGGTNVGDIFYKSVSNEIIIFNRENKHFGIVQTNTPRRIVLNINWK